MTKSVSNLISVLSVGDPTAEADAEFLFDRGCFVETDVFEACADLSSPLFIVGRRGAGKTALAMALERRFGSSTGVLYTRIIPQSFYFAHAKALANSLAERTGINWEFLFTSLWATSLRSEWAQLLLEYYRVRDSGAHDLSVLEEFLKIAAPDPQESASARLSRYLSEITKILEKVGDDVVGTVNRLLATYRSERVTQSLGRIVRASNIKLVTIIDGLDENWDGSNTSAELVSGLLMQAAADFAPVGAITLAFIRENMYRRISNICPRWDRIEGYFYHIAWTEEEIKELILRRINSQTDSEVTWDKIFEPEVKGIPSLDYFIHRTQFKPREIILFCRYSLDIARRHRSEVIRESDVLEAERRYSENRLLDLLNEYQDSLPELRAIVDVFVGKSQIETVDEFLLMLDDFISSGKYAERAPRLSLIYPTREAILDLILGLGFVGVKLRGGDGSFIFKYYGEQGNVFKELTDIEEVGIHPAYEQALGLIQTQVEVAAKEANEAEIVAASASIATRIGSAHEKAVQILGQLRDIPPGMGGFRRYEELMQHAISFMFQGYLDNPRIQERTWTGTQIRDLIFDNTGETLFFRTIRDKHAAVTVPVECKNKMELEASDFHQIETRLAETAGFFAFICYRSGRMDPVRSEIAHLRDIHHRDNRKVVLLLSDANIAQLLRHRIRGKLDGLMYKMYTRYLTLYLV